MMKFAQKRFNNPSLSVKPSRTFQRALVCLALFISLNSHRAFSELLYEAHQQIVYEKKTHSGHSLSLDRLTLKSKTDSKDSGLQSIYLQSGLHGNEFLPVEFTHWLLKRIKQNESLLNRLAVDQLQIDFNLIANPDGFQKKSRLNSRFINLNRNFSHYFGKSREPTGPSPMSEVETKAISNWLSQTPYRVAIDIHGYVPWIVLPSEPEKFSLKNTIYQSWVKSIRNITTRHLRDYEIKTAMSLGDGGAFEDWAFWKKGIPSLCLEMKKNTHDPKSIEESFLTYENFIYQVVKSALDLPNSQKPELASQ